jgi:lysyl-tRNA synthetase class 1
MRLEKKVIGRGTWIDLLAYRIVEREKRLGRGLDLIRVESGLGASGIPHVGSLGDAVRAYGVKLALEDVGYRSELIAFSDDMDGLRKVPKGLPEWLHKYIAFPVSRIPDPFNCHSSYAEHMSSMLVDGLDKLGVEYRFQSGAKAYKSGLLNEQIRKILKNSKRIGEKIDEMLGQKKFEEVLPYFPVCKSCGKIYVAKTYKYLESEDKVLYRCEGETIASKFVKGCGYEGEVKINEGEGKLSWKGEFAARWQALDIRFEAYGKDIADSVKVNDWISDEVLGFPHPYHVMYEMFLDKSGKKISKSIGNVLTPQIWLRYGTPKSLLLLMYKRIIGTRTLSVDDIPNYMDEYDWLEDVYFGKVRVENKDKEIKLKGLYEYVNLLNPPKEPEQHIPYRLITQLATIAPQNQREGFVLERLKRYGIVKKVDDLRLVERVRLAINWAEDFARPKPIRVKINEKEVKALNELIAQIEDSKDSKELQNAIFEVARSNGIEVKSFFKLLYQILIGSESGPRLGPYIFDVGRQEVIRQIKQALQSSHSK